MSMKSLALLPLLMSLLAACGGSAAPSESAIESTSPSAPSGALACGTLARPAGEEILIANSGTLFDGDRLLFAEPLAVRASAATPEAMAAVWADRFDLPASAYLPLVSSVDRNADGSGNDFLVWAGGPDSMVVSGGLLLGLGEATVTMGDSYWVALSIYESDSDAEAALIRLRMKGTDTVEGSACVAGQTIKFWATTMSGPSSLTGPDAELRYAYGRFDTPNASYLVLIGSGDPNIEITPASGNAFAFWTLGD